MSWGMSTSVSYRQLDVRSQEEDGDGSLTEVSKLSRLGQIMIRPNRHLPRFLGPDCSKERKKPIAGRKGLHATFCAFPRAWAAPTWVEIITTKFRD